VVQLDDAKICSENTATNTGSIECEKDTCKAAAKLIDNKVASRIFAKDASLYNFSDEAYECASNYMGWTDLASNPPYPIEKIQTFADRAVASGVRTVVLLGQGGSTQASMTVTKYNKIDKNRVDFRTIDSDSPVRFRSIFAELDPQSTLFLVSSKSGTTLEPQEALYVVKSFLRQAMPEQEIPWHLVAITDPGSSLAKQATEEGWRGLFYGEESVGGRYSALSVFGLLPAALVGIDLHSFMENARIAESICSKDSESNPALQLAGFLYDNYKAGRDKFSFLSPKRGRVLGLWIEQLVAESLGKEGHGILPNIEVDSLLLVKDPGDRTAIMYETKNDLCDETVNFLQSLNYIDKNVPQLRYKIDSVDELPMHFIMWEYAIAMCGYLIGVCPFDQPDVASAKAAVLNILESGMPEPSFTEDTLLGVEMGKVEVNISSALLEGCDEGGVQGSAVDCEADIAQGGAKKRAADCAPDGVLGSASEAAPSTLDEALAQLFGSIEAGDYCACLAFLPYAGEGRREALESIRHDIAEVCGVPACLEVGPRYLHSTGQLHKGGPNNGVFLIISADELTDIPADEKAKTIGNLAKAQATGDFETLSARGRRCVHVHLPDNTGVTLRALAKLVRRALWKR
jgi:glucose-6-phosphate isomerase